MDRTKGPGAEVLLFTPAEYVAVQAAVAAGAGGRAGGQPCTLNSLFERWSAVVLELEEGYAWSAPEFDNDIWCRSALGTVWPQLPPRVRSVRQPELDGLDDRFRAATVPWPGRRGEDGAWWKWRIPRLLEAETGDRCAQGWPLGWDMMPFPKPGAVTVVV
ncbi:hypothetical protein AB0D04_04360 [Streptomyces sp. NPDC048483]|uniref:hypothetical protein n=1 Tax=Streptomyces sp. NPDC048483 TaxID=3154927 RepID=UPI00343BD7CF